MHFARPANQTNNPKRMTEEKADIMKEYPRGQTPVFLYSDGSPFTADDFKGDVTGALNDIIKKWKTHGGGQRLGQFFCNYFVKESMPDLYHQQDKEKAKEVIREYLLRHQYFDKAPPRVR